MDALKAQVIEAVANENMPAWDGAEAAITKAFVRAADEGDRVTCKALDDVVAAGIGAMKQPPNYTLHQRLMRLSERVSYANRAGNKTLAAPPPTRVAPMGPPGRPVPKRGPSYTPTRPITPTGLGSWGDDYRGIPNELARTGLVTVRHPKERCVLTNEAVQSMGNRAVYYSGEQLTIRDEDVYLQVCQFQRNAPLGSPLSRTPAEFLDGLGWPSNGRTHRDLHAHLERLSRAHVRIVDLNKTEDGVGYEISSSNLFNLTTAHSESGRLTAIEISMPKNTKSLWSSLGYTLIDWQQRKALPTSLAKYLHRFYASHRKPHDLTLSFLHSLTGHPGSAARFRADLEGALQQLCDAGFLIFYTIGATGLVHVTRSLTPVPACEASK